MKWRFAMWSCLALLPVTACTCDREIITDLPDAAVPDAGPPDAGPPPPEFGLKPGDELRYPPPMNVVFCNETLGRTDCTEQSTTWQSTYTITDEGARIDSATNAWILNAEYFWQVAERKKTDDPSFQTLSKLWLASFGPWEEDTGVSSPRDNVLDFKTTQVMLKDGAADTFPFLDMTRFTDAAQQFETYVKSLDPEARVETQEAARKFEAGYLEPGDPTQLHFIQVIYHPLGFVCQLQEAIGPWDPMRLKNASGFRNNQRDFQANINAPRLTRAEGPKANMLQFCKCGTQAGTDCE